MRLLLLILINVLNFSCSHHPERRIANDTSESVITLGYIAANNSNVKLYPPREGRPNQHSFYFELRDSDNILVDVGVREISILNKRKLLKTRVERLAEGEYEVVLLEDVNEISTLEFLVQNQRIEHNLKLKPTPSRRHSKISIISNQYNMLRLEFELRDDKGNLIEFEDSPEIILEGLGQITSSQPLAPAVWEIEIEYPEQNQIFYFSVRVNDVLMERIFRFQHVEK